MNKLLTTQQNLLSNLHDDVVFMFVKPRSPNWGYVRELLQSGKIHWFDDDKKEYCASFSFSKDSIFVIRSIWRYVKFWKTCTVFVRGVSYNDTQSYENWLDCYLESFDFENKEEYCSGCEVVGYTATTETIVVSPCKCRGIWFRYYDIWYNQENKDDIIQQFHKFYIHNKIHLCPLFDLKKVENIEILVRQKVNCEDEHHEWTIEEAKDLYEMLGMDMPLKELSFLKTSTKQNKSFSKILFWIMGALMLLIIFS